jgi:1-aminocyclopropane-1-carboxylate deaminase
MLQYNETPIQEINDKITEAAGVRLLIKREDLNHPFVSGNKWWKLKYNLEEASRNKIGTLITYGGAFSNHILATSAAAAELGFQSVGIIRGEETLPLNSTLLAAQKFGMEFRYISRSAYRSKSPTDAYLQNYQNYYLIPEGGSNKLAIKGVSEFASKLDVPFDYLCCAVGTGGTLGGLIEGLPTNKRIIGFPVLKNGEFLIDEIGILSEKSRHVYNWELMIDFHFGGYARSTPQLIHFIEQFKVMHDIPLEFVYTGKMMAGIYELLAKGFFKRGSTILAIHSGGIHLVNS